MDLKSFREDKLKIKTQAQFAELIEVDQSSISRWEKEPDSIPYQIIQRILEKTGASFEELTGWKKPIPEPLRVYNTWSQVDFTKMTMMNYILKEMEELNLPEDIMEMYVNDLNLGIVSSLIKPKVAIVGRSDTGKSTLINALLGSAKLPTAWTPTTSIAVYLKHIDDRPNFIEDDVWMFADCLETETMWDERNLNNEEYCRSWKIAAGGVDILRSFGTRQGEDYDKSAGSAVVFIDAPILKTCDVIDLPGFGTEEDKDDNITFAASQKADIVIYLSQANGFMRIEDITYLKRNISELPIWEKEGENDLSPLSNLFVVASQAHTVENGNRTQLSKILDVGCRNLLKTLPDKYWDEREEASGYQYNNAGEILRSRFYGYTTDISEICKPFNESLSSILEALPLIINTRTKSFIRDYVGTRMPSLIAEIDKYEGIVKERSKYEELLKEIEANELTRVRDLSLRKKIIKGSIDSFQLETNSEISDLISKTVNVDTIVSLMVNKGIQNKKDSIQQFGSYFTSMIQEECESILKEKADSLSITTEGYISDFSRGISNVYENSGLKDDFDAGWAFASGISRVKPIGAFGSFLSGSIYAKSIIINAGFILGPAGFLFAPAFGPIGIAVGLLIAGGLVELFTGGWKKSVAKKIVSQFEEIHFLNQYQNFSYSYWKQTSDAFDAAAKELDNEWDRYVSSLRDTVVSYDIDNIQSRITMLTNTQNFFKNLPLYSFALTSSDK